MAVYKKIFPRRTGGDFLKIESRDLLPSKTKNWPVLIYVRVEPHIERIRKNTRRVAVFFN